jgi:hypothetical protein
MEILIRLRPANLLAFTLGVLMMVYAMANRGEILYLVGAAIGFGGITAFLVTEAFGRIAKTRSAVTRWLARIFLVPSLLVLVSVFFLIGQRGFNHVGV